VSAGKALQVMIDNNLSFEVALYPYELVTYGEKQVRSCKTGCSIGLSQKYLEELTESKTLSFNPGILLVFSRAKRMLQELYPTNGLHGWSL
jgi:urocanate hydratase